MNQWCLTDQERLTLINIAKQSIEFGASNNQPLKIEGHQYSDNLCQQGSSFVTLYLEGKLRGCIGQLEASMPIIEDVAEHAFAAAYSDSRFPAIASIEIPFLDIHISLLSEKEPIKFCSEQNLVEQLKPGEDGIIFRSGSAQGTFLPDVWKSIPDPKNFLNQIKIKAGLASTHWGEDIKVWRYRTLSIP